MTRLVPAGNLSPDEEKKILEELLKPVPAQLGAGSAVFSIADLGDGYRVGGVNYHGRVGVWDFAKNALPGKTQDAYADHARSAKPDEFRASSAPLLYAICKALYKNKDGSQKALVEKAKQSIAGIIGPGKPWINTLSRAAYNPAGLDEVVHDYKQNTQYNKSITLVGPDGFITKSETKATEYVQALLDTTDTPAEVKGIFKWITGKEAYAYRLNNKPKNKEERVVALGVNFNVRFNLSADVSIGYDWPAFGVRAQKKFHMK